MKVEETRCDYCTHRDDQGHFGQVTLSMKVDMSKLEVCQNCQDRISEFIQNTLMDRTALRELARHRKSALAPRRES